MSEQKEQIKALLNKHGLTVESVFVPFSRSRNAGEKSPSLNWVVTLKHNGKNILTTDYSAGCGHCPSYKQGQKIYANDAVVLECEKGFKAKAGLGMHYYIDTRKPILPDSVDVVYSLLMDAEVLDYSSYEEWAGNFGYDEDSRKGEQVYNACMKIALQFRRIGGTVINELREAYQDY